MATVGIKGFTQHHGLMCVDDIHVVMTTDLLLLMQGMYE